MVVDNSFPHRTRTYRNHHLDSSRWDHFTPRDGDIVVATSFRSGTTWMQMIVRHLLFEDTEKLLPVMSLSPWIDSAFMMPLKDMIESLEAQEHRRAVKSHLPLDGIPFFSQLKYIVVGRDARDVFMSIWNFYSDYADGTYDRLNQSWGDASGPFPRCPEDIKNFWNQWINQGWFDWESEGYPFWSNLWHTQSWWNHRAQENILFVHYNDLSVDLTGQIRRVADFLGIELSEGRLHMVADAVTFKNMKTRAESIVPEVKLSFRGGVQTFINMGINERWVGVLNDDDLAQHEAAVARVLTPECAQWLEHGSLK